MLSPPHARRTCLFPNALTHSLLIPPRTHLSPDLSTPTGYNSDAPALTFVLGAVLAICSAFCLWKAIKWSVLWRLTATKLLHQEQQRRERGADVVVLSVTGKVKQWYHWYQDVTHVDATYASYGEVAFEMMEVIVQVFFVTRVYAGYGYTALLPCTSPSSS